MILRFILWSILLTLLFRFVVRFLFPLFQVTKVVSQKMRDMQSQMNNMNKQAHEPKPQKVKPGDYIDYEEIK